MTDESLRALADLPRARIVDALAGEQLCGCHLVELTGATCGNVSNHLAVLRRLGGSPAAPSARSRPT